MKYLLTILNIVFLAWFVSLAWIVPMAHTHATARQIDQLEQVGVIDATAARTHLKDVGRVSEKWELALATEISTSTSVVRVVILPAACILLLNTLAVAFLVKKQTE